MAEKLKVFLMKMEMLNQEFLCGFSIIEEIFMNGFDKAQSILKIFLGDPKEGNLEKFLFDNYFF
jgi:hypothetical protein